MSHDTTTSFPPSPGEPPKPRRPVLTPEQKAWIKENCRKLDLDSMVRHISGDPTLDQRSIWGLVLKSYLGGIGVTDLWEKKASPTKGPYVLTDEEKRQIESLAGKTKNCIELARILFNNPGLQPLSREYRAVWTYYKEVYPQGLETSDEVVEESQYEPPNSLSGLCALVNECVPSRTGKKTFTYGYLTTEEERQLRALMSYMRILRFRVRASEYDRKVDRNLFIDTFVRFTYDKWDLTQPEIDQYISAAVETLTIIHIERDLRQITKTLEELMNGDRNQRGQFMPVVELINTTRGRLEQSKKMLQSYLAELEGTRRDRMESRDQRNSSILNLFDAFQRSEEKRKQLASLGNKMRDEDKQVIEKIKNLSEMDGVVALIAGQTLAEGAG